MRGSSLSVTGRTLRLESSCRPPAQDPGSVPDLLVLATLRAVVRVTRHQLPLPLALPRRTAWLVRATLAEDGKPCPKAP